MVIYKPSVEVVKKPGSKLEFPEEAKNKITFGEWVEFAKSEQELFLVMPSITDVKAFNDGAVVIVTFSDGSREKAVAQGELCPSIEQGIAICVAKKMFSFYTHSDQGTSVYGKIVKHGLKVYENKIKEQKRALIVEKEEKERRQRINEKKKRKRAKREAIRRMEQVEIQKEAYMRALEEM